jgi:hypothetical protein
LYNKGDEVRPILRRADAPEHHGGSGKVAVGIRDEPVERVFRPDLPCAAASRKMSENIVAFDRADPAADETVQMRPDPMDRTVADHVAGGAGR